MKRTHSMLRILSMILVFVMVFSLVPVFANAAGNVASATVNGNTIGYATVQAAVDAAAASGGTVTLLCDVELEESVSCTTGTVTIDLANHTLTAPVSVMAPHCPLTALT